MTYREQIPGLLLDFDGTLADSIGPLREAFYSFCLLQGNESQDIAFEDLMSQTLADVVRHLHHRYAWNAPADQLLSEYMEFAQTAVMEAVPMPNASWFMHACRQLGSPICIVTSGEESTVWQWLAEYSLDGLVESVVGSTAATKPKPSPEPYLQAANRISKSIRRCIAVEDSEVGALSACRAGATTYIVGNRRVSGARSVPTLMHVYDDLERMCTDL